MHSNRILFTLAAFGLATGAAAQASAKQSSELAATKYCIEYEQVTGSRIRHSACLTRSEWANRGVDVDEVLKQ